MLRHLPVLPLVAQLVVIATIALRIAKQHVVATDAVAIIALVSYAS